MTDGAPVDVEPYVPERLLATGAQAQVWLAKGPEGAVVLKVARTDADRAALAREIEVLSLGEHPRIVRMLRRADDARWIALQHIAGLPLDKWAEKQPVDAILDAALQLVDALRYLHRNGVVHADLKPANLLVDKKGRLTVIDLGIAVLPGEERRRFRGTLGFAAPELLRNERPSARTDGYGLGAVLYAALARRMPFMAADPAALTWLPLVTLPLPPSTFRPDTPALLDQLILALLSRNPARRPTDLERVASILTKARSTPASTPVLGMLEERDELRRAVVGAADDEPRVVVLYGPAGCGRKTLLTEALEAARREGLTYVKPGDPAAVTAAVEAAPTPPVLVLRASQRAAPVVAKLLLDKKQSGLLLLHADKPIPALVKKGAIHLTPAPLSEEDALQLARHMGADPEVARRQAREHLGLPAAVLGGIRAWRRQHGRDVFRIEALPKESRRVWLSLPEDAPVRIAELAARLDLGEHALLDHCEVLFAEGLVEAAEDGAALRRLAPGTDVEPLAVDAIELEPLEEA